MSTLRENHKFQALADLGAGEFEHLNGSLEKHLKNTASLLINWGARDALCDAGLYHAAYGTAAFEQAMVGLEMRDKIAIIIGEDAEELVYLYCSCDRKYTFANIGKNTIQFRDRFTSEEFTLTPEQAKDFCELTVANEMELVLDSEAFKQQHGKGLFALFQDMSPWLCDAAKTCYQESLVSLVPN